MRWLTRTTDPAGPHRAHASSSSSSSTENHPPTQAWLKAIEESTSCLRGHASTEAINASLTYLVELEEVLYSQKAQWGSEPREFPPSMRSSFELLPSQLLNRNSVYNSNRFASIASSTDDDDSSKEEEEEENNDLEEA
jgi:hypothetical protein